jgi:hypothetical protein
MWKKEGSIPGATYPMVPLIAIEEVEFEATKEDAEESNFNLASPKSPT